MIFLRACLPAIMLCLFPLLGMAQIQPANLAGIAHVAIRVADLTRSRIFYQKLGFEQAFVSTKDGKTTEAFLKVNDRQFIEIYSQQDPSQPIGFMHVCFEATDLEALNRAYVGRSLSPTPVKRAGAGNLLFTMVGPEQQNIEYTQYMPGSLHSKDQGQHLGANRISKEIIGISLSMEDPVAARAFYQQSLGFHESRHPLEPGLIPLLLPGSSDQMVEITPNVFQFLFSVPSLRHAAAQLKELNLPVEKQGTMLTVKDPDGNRVVFVAVEPETGRRLLQMPKMPKLPWPTKP
jgi:catechol 2,3-dioxygenase-like lactoylglutathione lyase family enzyme